MIKLILYKNFIIIEIYMYKIFITKVNFVYKKFINIEIILQREFINNINFICKKFIINFTFYWIKFRNPLYRVEILYINLFLKIKLYIGNLLINWIFYKDFYIYIYTYTQFHFYLNIEETCYKVVWNLLIK